MYLDDKKTWQAAFWVVKPGFSRNHYTQINEVHKTKKIAQTADIGNI
jgi:hypothetical protein